jgi:hypothetical protein
MHFLYIFYATFFSITKTLIVLSFFLEQLKETREITNKSKKEINKLQRQYNLLVKYAKQWGKMIEEQGNLSVIFITCDQCFE